MRASVLVLGPLLARKREATVSLPGGCAIGARPIDIHIEALQRLGAEFSLEQGYIKCKASKGLIGCELDLPKISVGASENIIMAACLAKGESKIKNIAIEPEVIDLVDCLKSMGANIELTDNRTILIQGVDEMKGTSHTIIPDRIEALTYVIAGALNAENLLIKDINISHIQNVLDSLVKLNIAMEIKDNEISVKKTSIEEGIELDTEEFPGFPTDLQAQMMVLMSLGKKKSIIKENIFENRFMHVPELNRMGGNIEISGKKAIIHPCDGFLGAQVMATDLRASVSLVLAGLVADGETTLNRIYHLDRGYENIEKKLQACGADIKRI
jgi:UDP-N-acetylglucosamine 1-carboxyvinyltransferase